MEAVTTIVYYAGLALVGLAMVSLIVGGIVNVVRATQSDGRYAPAVMQVVGGLAAFSGGAYVLLFPRVLGQVVDEPRVFLLHLYAGLLTFGLGLLVFAAGFLVDSARHLDESARPRSAFRG